MSYVQLQIRYTLMLTLTIVGKYFTMLSEQISKITVKSSEVYGKICI